jgi:gliding motility-associated-like protein
VSSFAWAQERVDITTCAGTGTGIVCVAPADSLYKLCVKVTPGPCSDKNYTIDWGDGKVEKIVLSAALTLNHEYDLKTFVKNCQSGEFKASIFVENATCPNDNKGFRVTFNKNPQAQPDVSTACEGQSIYINNKSCPVSSDVKFLWEFSDGQVSNSTYPSISFSDPNKTYKVKLTATSQNCGNSSKEIDFKISKLPVPNIKTTGTSVINKDTVVCLSGGGVISLDGTVSTDETDYYWQVSGGKFTFQDKTGNYSDVIRIKLEEVKEYTITFTARNNCGSKILVKKIKVVDLPLLSLTPQPDVCEEIAYKIPNPVAEGVYSLNGKTVDPSQSIPLVFSATPYVISAKLSNACGTQMVSDTFMVGAAQAVKILTVGKDTVVCVSAASITFKANFTGGDWTGLTTQGNEKVFIPTTPGDYTVSYSKGVGKCFSKDEVHVKVDGIQATATDQAICAGTPFTLLKASPTGGAWSTNSCINCLKGDTLLTGGLSSNQVELTYSVSSATGCKASAAAKVTLGRPKANFSIGGGCAGGTFQPTNTSSGAGAYAWFVNGKSVSSESSPKLNLSPGLQKIMLVAQAGNCSDTLRKEVTIVAPPSPISFTPNTSLGCSPLKVTLQPDGTATAGSEYSWDFGNGSVYKGFEPPSQVFENQEKQNRTFKIVVTVKNSCGQETESKEVVVRPKARAEIGVDSTTLRCTPAQILFSNRSSGHDKDQSHWTFGDGITRTTPSDTVYHSFAARDSSRTFKVQLDVMSACGRDTASVSIQVYPTTVKALYTISKSVVCPGEEVRFSDASVPKPTNWIWKFGDGTISTLPNPTHTFAGAQKSYKVTLIAFTSCGYDSTQLTVKTTDAISGNFDDIPLACEGSAIQFVNKTDTQLGFFWDFGDGSPLDSSHYSPVHTYSKTGNYTTTLSVFRGSKTCQVVAKKAVITVASAVRANFGFNKDSVFCAPGPVAIVNLSENADTFFWRFSDGRTSAVASPALPFEPGLYSVKLVASKGGFCKDSVERAAAVTVKQCQVDIPTAFTPNGDGYGDRYTLFGSGILRIDKLLIRNRWGEIVFEMKDVLPGSQQPDASWDGTYKGQPAPADMYVYEAVILYVDNRRSEKLRGNIYLAR